MIGFHNEPLDTTDEPVSADTTTHDQMLTDFAETLHDIASKSNEAGTVRMAINALIRHDIGIKVEFGE